MKKQVRQTTESQLWRRIIHKYVKLTQPYITQHVVFERVANTSLVGTEHLPCKLNTRTQWVKRLQNARIDKVISWSKESFGGPHKFIHKNRSRRPKRNDAVQWNKTAACAMHSLSSRSDIYTVIRTYVLQLRDGALWLLPEVCIWRTTARGKDIPLLIPLGCTQHMHTDHSFKVASDTCTPAKCEAFPSQGNFNAEHDGMRNWTQSTCAFGCRFSKLLCFYLNLCVVGHTFLHRHAWRRSCLAHEELLKCAPTSKLAALFPNTCNKILRLWFGYNFPWSSGGKKQMFFPKPASAAGFLAALVRGRWLIPCRCAPLRRSIFLPKETMFCEHGLPKTLTQTNGFASHGARSRFRTPFSW